MILEKNIREDRTKPERFCNSNRIIMRIQAYVLTVYYFLDSTLRGLWLWQVNFTLSLSFNKHTICMGSVMFQLISILYSDTSSRVPSCLFDFVVVGVIGVVGVGVVL